MWKFEKEAGQIIDHQDDPGVGWEKTLEKHWPQDLPKPELGIKKDASDCAADLSDGDMKVAKYPIDTPEDALASSMYFLAYGRDSIEKDAHAPIARNLQQARVSHGVSLPESFKQELTSMQKEASHEKTAYADDGENLPVSTPDQCKSSVHTFRKHASKWDADDRLVIAHKLQHAADKHNLGVDLKLASEEISKEAAEEALDSRREVMDALEDHPHHIAYMSKIKSIKDRLPKMEDYRDLLKAAAELEEADKTANMDVGWNDYYPDPARTFVEDRETDPLAGFETEKNAEMDWSELDIEGLRKHTELNDRVVNKIEEDPEKIIPTLPRPEKEIIQSYVEEYERE